MTQTVEPITSAERTAETAMSVERYHQLIAAGILTEDDRVELLENRIVEKMSKNPPHASSKRKLRILLDRLLPEGWMCFAEDPITLADSEPEPDCAIVSGVLETYVDRHPGAPETAIVIEIADSSLARDRGSKLRIYARGGIATYWIVNLIDRVVEVYTHPRFDSSKPFYETRTHFGENDAIPVIVGGQTIGVIAVRDILP